MTSMRQALEKAGFSTPEERLERIVSNALAAKGWDAQKDSLFAAVRKDAEVMWLVFARDRVRVLTALLQDEARKRRVETTRLQEVGGGQTCYAEGQYVDALSDAIEGDVLPGKYVPKQVRLAGSVLGDVGRQAQAVKRDAMLRIAGETARQIATLTLLDTFRIEGRAIGDFKAGEASAWAKKTGSQAKFVELLVTGLQPDMIIRQYVRPEEAEACMSRAREITYA